MVMIKKSVRLRTDYEPLTVTASISVGGSLDSLRQLYNADTGEYEPSRALEALVLKLNVSAAAADGTASLGLDAVAIDSAKWYVNGTEFTVLKNGDTSWNSSFVNTSADAGDLRCSLNILRDTLIGEIFNVYFEGKIYDSRTNANVKFETQPVTLVTAVKGHDAYSLAFGGVTSYSPWHDYKLGNEYAAAVGKPQPFGNDEANNSPSYMQEFPISLAKGSTAVSTEEYSVSVLKDDEALVDTDFDVVSVSNTSLVLDMRLIEKASYTVIASVADVEVARKTLSVVRTYTAYDIEPVRKVSISPKDTHHINEALVTTADRVMKIPEPYLRILWETSVDGDNTKTWNEGSRLKVGLAEAGFYGGASSLSVSTLSEPRHAMVYLSEDDGSVLVDDEGNVLIDYID